MQSDMTTEPQPQDSAQPADKELQWLKHLHRSRYLTDQEFEAARAELLAWQAPPPPAARAPAKPKSNLRAYLLAALLIFLLGFFAVYSWRRHNDPQPGPRAQFGQEYQQRSAEFERAFKK